MNKGVAACTIAVFSKAPDPGTVKTRLLPALSGADAADIYKMLLEQTLSTVTGGNSWVTRLFCTPVADHPYFLQCREKYKLELRPQSSGDLGMRMYSAIADSLKQFKYVLLVGCDCPDLQRQDLITAMDKLARGYDVVLGPTEDGGYYLIGMADTHPQLFQGISWGTASVLETTRSLLRKLGLKCHELPVRWDLDDTEDLKRWKTQLQE